MAQQKKIEWTNPSTAVLRNESVGFEVDEITITNLTSGGQFYWNSGMAADSYLTVSTGAITSSNGISAVAQDGLFGAPVTGVSNAASAVITASYLDQFDFAVGDTVKLTDVADDSANDGDTTLNFSGIVTAVSATTVTVAVNTSSGYAVYVSGGYLVRVSDANGVPVPIVNRSIRGLAIGTGAVGGNDESMVAIVRGSNNVV